MPEKAEGYWRNLLKHRPRYAASLLKTADQYPSVDFVDCLPEDAKVYENVVAEIILRKNHQYDALLPKFIEGLDCTNTGTIGEKVRCLRLRALANRSIGRLELAKTSFAEAIEIDADNARLRLEYISILRESGDREGALMQARIGRYLDANDARFDQVIRQMAEDDLKSGLQ